MKKLLVIGLLALISGVGMISCGNDAGFDAVVITPVTSVSITGNLAGGEEFPLAGMQFLVQKSSNDTTPVPGVSIKMESGALAGDIFLCAVPWSGISPTMICTKPLAQVSILKMTTSDTGAVLVYPLLSTQNSCSGTSGTIQGEGSVSGIISTDMGTVDVTFNVDC
ncbi:MAG TPA: hypothetical protein VML36_04110 [Nitrospiria bacterium]|nr:hypothetical protein [Nitrospiria bacterium]